MKLEYNGERSIGSFSKFIEETTPNLVYPIKVECNNKDCIIPEMFLKKVFLIINIILIILGFE